MLTPDLSTVDLPEVAEGCPKEVPGLEASLFTLSAPLELLDEGLWVTDSVLRFVLAELRRTCPEDADLVLTLEVVLLSEAERRLSWRCPLAVEDETELLVAAEVLLTLLRSLATVRE